MILLNPGPVNISPRVQKALGRGDLCHREEEFAALLASIRSRLLEAFAPGGEYAAVLLTGSGTAAVEAAVRSVCSPRGRLGVVVNGVYGERIAAMARAAGLEPEVLRGDWLTPPDLERVAGLLRAPGVEALAVVHHETTAGLLNPLAELGKLARAAGKLLLVDAVSALAAEDIDLAATGIDLCAGSASKAIQALPGLAFVLVRRPVMERLAGYPPRSLYLHLPLHHAEQERGSIPFTPAVQLAYVLDEALAELLQEGVAARAARYRAAARFLRAGFAALGLECVLPPELRASSLTALWLPPGLEYRVLHDRLKERGFVIYAGQGHLARSIFRVANMGHLALADFRRFLGALGEVL